MILAVGCDSSDKANNAHTLVGRNFLSRSITDHGANHPLVAGTRLGLGFTEGHFTAGAGCNTLSGRAALDEGRVRVSEVESTAMGCPAGLAEQDQWVSDFLALDPTFTVDGMVLTLTADGIVMVLGDRRVEDPDRPLTGTRWIVDTVIDAAGLDSGTSSSGHAQTEAYLVFSESTVTGSTGCRDITASVTLSAHSIAASGVALHGDPCTTAAFYEPAMVATLDGQLAFAIEASRLTLTKPDGSGISLYAAST